MTENEWRGIGVQQSKGWVHYMIHTPGEPRFLTPRRISAATRLVVIAFRPLFERHTQTRRYICVCLYSRAAYFVIQEADYCAATGGGILNDRRREVERRLMRTVFKLMEIQS